MQTAGRREADGETLCPDTDRAQESQRERLRVQRVIVIENRADAGRTAMLAGTGENLVMRCPQQCGHEPVQLGSVADAGRDFLIDSNGRPLALGSLRLHHQPQVAPVAHQVEWCDAIQQARQAAQPGTSTYAVLRPIMAGGAQGSQVVENVRRPPGLIGRQAWAQAGVGHKSPKWDLVVQVVLFALTLGDAAALATVAVACPRGGPLRLPV